jgi:hypothetical protein
MSDCLRTDGVYRTACAELPYTANETVEHCENAKEGKDPVKIVACPAYVRDLPQCKSVRNVVINLASARLSGQDITTNNSSKWNNGMESVKGKVPQAAMILPLPIYLYGYKFWFRR